MYKINKYLEDLLKNKEDSLSAFFIGLLLLSLYTFTYMLIVGFIFSRIFNVFLAPSLNLNPLSIYGTAGFIDIIYIIDSIFNDKKPAIFTYTYVICGLLLTLL